MIHPDPHPRAGQTVRLQLRGNDPLGALVDGAEYRVEDWWDRITGDSWMVAKGNPAALNYALRAGLLGLVPDNEVVYGKVDNLGHLVHASEIAEEAS